MAEKPTPTKEFSRLVGPGAAKALVTIGITDQRGLLFHFPRRYLKRGEYTTLSELRVGENVTVAAEVVDFSSRRARNGSMTLVDVTVSDGRTRLPMRFFARHQGTVHGLKHALTIGTSAIFSGEVENFNGTIQLKHPEFEPFDTGDVLDDLRAAHEAERPVPVYPATAKVSSLLIRRAMRMVVDPLHDGEVNDPVPAEIVERRGMLDATQAMRMIHRPHAEADYRRAQHRFRYTEAFLLQTALARRRADIAAYEATPRPPRPGALLDALDAQLPFALTGGQLEVSAEISADLAAPSPMQRLLQGEVGSGKTVVALRAMMQVIDAGGQAALLAPTEVLAQQHARSIRNLLGPLGEAGMLGGAADGTRVALLTGSLSAAQRRQALADAASGAAGIVIGTHSLLNEKVQFADLALTVIDEQHRFGVEQRDALRAKGRTVPHQLYMTATPIPRSVAMTFFGDVEVSTLREVPAGRSPITTHLVPVDRPKWVARTWQLVAEAVERGERAYVVAPRITANGGDDGADLLDAPDDKRPLATVEEVAELLEAEPVLSGIAVGVMHGRLPSDEKDAVMEAFSAGCTPVLVTTTVIEVGVDVPEASVMVVMDADRFGLSQLHQLRGRVGRGSAPGTCLLVTGAGEDTPALQRLKVLTETTDGFVLAEKDLEQRREGDVLGAAQSGRGNSLKLLRVFTDRGVIEEAREDARRLIAEDPNLVHHPDLLVAITQLVDPDHEEFLDRA
ncbi:ATP-dependent DNA helicase RecG [Occultella aeris]|uniref:Probable DNA 3'-5' helicase RecG n=1 Tax=Occultella aeris TaxID=2761496 RepID=A0A7M4DN44_9MICO|nr:ATP-dependent DNA helicase RecG [Occultella aeris]VZO38854.1 ATP-dependent DNA helicase RecG [Occultella aeris]